jgi:hypothetical protein
MPLAPEDNLADGGPADNLTSGQSDQRPNTTEPAANLSYPTTFEPNTKNRQGIVAERPPNLPEAIESYNEAAERCGWVHLREFTENRRIKARAAWRRLGGKDGWLRLVAEARRQSFLGGANDRGWRMDFDFFVSQAGAAKILEGKYLTPDERASVPDAKEQRRRRALFEHDGTWHPTWGPPPTGGQA